MNQIVDTNRVFASEIDMVYGENLIGSARTANGGMKMGRLIDADAAAKYLREFRCADCDKRKGLKNGKIRFCYEIGDAPCRACDIGDVIDYFLDEDIAPTVDAIPVGWLEAQRTNSIHKWDLNFYEAIQTVLTEWQKEQEG